MRLIALGCVLVLSACVSSRPAPVVDRQAPVVASGPVTEAGYVVKRGDTVYSIARQHGVDPRDLIAWNQLAPSAPLAIGQVLQVKAPGESPTTTLAVNPAISTTTIEGKPLAPPTGANIASNPAAPVSSSTASSTSSTTTAVPAASAIAGGVLKTQPKPLKLPYSEQNVISIQRAEAPSTPQAAPPTANEGPPTTATDAAKRDATLTDTAAVANYDGIEWSWPAAGKLTGRFGEAGNKGIEISGRIGDPIYAAAGGKVTYSGAGVRGYGNLIIIKHNDKYLSAYAHNQNLLVKQWQTVKKGQKIAEMGTSGTDSPKLHFEIRLLSKPVDPETYLPPRRD